MRPVGSIRRASAVLIGLATLFAGIVAWTYPGAAVAADPSSVARAYLTAAQRQDGEIGTVPVIDTAEAVGALLPGPARDSAIFALSQARPDNTEAAFLRAAVLAGTPFDDLVSAAALRSAVVDGSLGLMPGSTGRDVLVLASALRFGAVDSAAGTLVPQIVSDLCAVQRADGGFGFADEPSDLAVTGVVGTALLSVQGYGPAAACLQHAQVFLEGLRSNRQGLVASDIALLLLALDKLPLTGVQVLAADLLARQGPDGSFDGGDVRGTALAIRALQVGSPDLTVEFMKALESHPGDRGDLRVEREGRQRGQPGIPGYSSGFHADRFGRSGRGIRHRPGSGHRTW